MHAVPRSTPRALPLWAAFLLSALSGALMACSFIPVDWSGCVWIALLPLLTALGAARDDDEVVVWNQIRELGSMSQTSYLFR